MNENPRPGLTSSCVAQIMLRSTPVDNRLTAKAKRRLVVNVDTLRDIRERNDVDIVGGLLGGRLDSRLLDKTREAFAVTLGGRVHPVADRNSRTSVWETSVDITSIDSRDGCCVSAHREQGADKGGAGAGLHDN